MGSGVYKQPNGLLAIFSSVTDMFWAWDCTPEEAWTWLVFHSRQSTEGAARNISAALNPDGSAALERRAWGELTWETRLARMEDVHGEDSTKDIRAFAEAPYTHPPYSCPLFDTIKGLRLGEPGSKEPDPKWEHPSYLYDLPGKDEADVLRQWHKMTGGLNLSDDPSKVAMIVIKDEEP